MSFWPHLVSVAPICDAFCSFSFSGSHLSGMQTPRSGLFSNASSAISSSTTHCALRGQIGGTRLAKFQVGEDFLQVIGARLRAGAVLLERLRGNPKLPCHVLDDRYGCRQEIIRCKAQIAQSTHLQAEPQVIWLTAVQ